VWLHIPVTEEAKRRNFALNHVQTHKIQSHNSGFIQFDLERIFDVFDDESLKIRSWDGHPSKMAHEIIAKELLIKIIENQNKLGLKLQTEKK
jgi:hypothetical protein